MCNQKIVSYTIQYLVVNRMIFQIVLYVMSKQNPFGQLFNTIHILCKYTTYMMSETVHILEGDVRNYIHLYYCL